LYGWHESCLKEQFDKKGSFTKTSFKQLLEIPDWDGQAKRHLSTKS